MLQQIEDDLDPKKTGKVFNVLGDVFPSNQLERMLREMYAHNLTEEVIKNRIVKQIDTAQFRQITLQSVERAESWVHEFSTGLADPKGFILPGDTQASASVSMARAITRRAERRVAELMDLKVIDNVQLVRFLNRLSSLLFVMELKEVAESDPEKLSFAKDKDK